MKSIFIFFFAAIFANHISIVMSENCSEQKSTERSDNCTFECIQILYEKKFCKGHQTEKRLIPVHPNNILETLMQYNSIGYNVSSKSLLSAAEQKNCDNIRSDDDSVEWYFQPIELTQYFNCKQNLSVISNDEKVNCTSDDVMRLYENITQRFNESQKWCIEALGINYANKKLSRQNSEHTTISSITVSQDSIDSKTTDTPIDGTTELNNDETTTELTTVKNAEVEITSVTEEMATTTQTPNQNRTTSTQSPSATTKPTKSKKPSRPVEHFKMSVTTIVLMVCVLLAILIISAIILSYYVNRRKRMEMRSDSRTYVFDTRE